MQPGAKKLNYHSLGFKKKSLDKKDTNFVN